MENITIKKYLSLPDTSEYNVLNHVQGVNRFAGKTFKLGDRSFGDIQLIKKLMSRSGSINELVALFCKFYGCTEKEFYNENVENFFKARRFIIDEVTRICKNETALLNSISFDSEIWKMAGGEKLNKYADILPLVQLGEIYSIYPFELMHKPYSQIITLLSLHKTKSEVNNEFINLKSKRKQ